MALDAYSSASDLAATKPAQRSAAAEFSDAFAHEGRQQMRALAQIGALDFDAGPQLSEATSKLAQHLQLLGSAAADAIPVLLIAAGSRCSFGRILAKEPLAPNLLLSRSVIGLSALEAGATGFISGALLKPSDDDTAKDLGSLLLDRSKSGIAGAVSFSALTGVNALMSAGAERLPWKLGRQVLANPIATGILSGLPGGLINTELDSFAHDGKFVGDSAKLEQSIYEMSLLGGIFGAVNVLTAKLSDNALSAASSSRLAGAIEHTTESPRFSGLFGDEQALDKALSERLPYRRYLRYDAADRSLIDADPERDWSNRADLLSESIARRTNSIQLSRSEFDKIRDQYPEHDRPIVNRLLELAAANSTDYGLKYSLHSIASQVQPGLTASFSSTVFLAGDAASSGNMLSYLMRKTVMSGPTTNYLNESVRPFAKMSLIFDDISNMSKEQHKNIAELASYSRVAIVDLNAFDRLPNFTDFARGTSAVTQKLETLLHQVKVEQEKTPSLTTDAAVDRVLHKEIDEAVRQLKSTYQDKATNDISVFRPTPISMDGCFRDRVDPKQVRAYLENKFAGNKAQVEQRILAAELLADDVEFHSFVTMASRLKSLGSLIELSAKENGLNPAEDRFVVALDGSGASEAFMTNIYARVNGIAPERIMTLNQVRNGDAEELSAKRLIMVDDAIYSGGQAASGLQSLKMSVRATIAALTAYDEFAQAMHNPYSKQSIVTTQTDFGLSPSRIGGPFDALPYSHFTVLKDFVLQDSGYSNLGSTKVYPHMTSDTSPNWLAAFAHKFLNVANPRLWPPSIELATAPKTEASTQPKSSASSFDAPVPVPDLPHTSDHIAPGLYITDAPNEIANWHHPHYSIATVHSLLKELAHKSSMLHFSEQIQFPLLSSFWKSDALFKPPDLQQSAFEKAMRELKPVNYSFGTTLLTNLSNGALSSIIEAASRTDAVASKPLPAQALTNKPITAPWLSSPTPQSFQPFALDYSRSFADSANAKTLRLVAGLAGSSPQKAWLSPYGPQPANNKMLLPPKVLNKTPTQYMH